MAAGVLQHSRLGGGCRWGVPVGADGLSPGQADADGVSLGSAGAARSPLDRVGATGVSLSHIGAAGMTLGCASDTGVPTGHIGRASWGCGGHRGIAMTRSPITAAWRRAACCRGNQEHPGGLSPGCRRQGRRGFVCCFVGNASDPALLQELGAAPGAWQRPRAGSPAPKNT